VTNKLKRLLHPRSALLACAALLLLCLPGFVCPATAQQREISVGAFVTSISDVTPEEGTYRIAFYAWFNDPAGKFDLQRDLYVVARTVTLSEVETEPTPSGGSYTFARIDAYVDQEYDFRDFPFDRQRLVLRLEAVEKVDELRFVPDTEDTRVSEYLRLLGWTVDGIALETTQHAYDTGFGYWTGRDDDFSQVVLTVDLTRVRSPVVIDDFLGFTFAFLITSLTFVVSCTELGLRVGMSTGSLFAAVINLNRLDDAVGFKPDFGLVDRLAFLIFGTILTALLISLTTHRLSKSRTPEEANRIDTRVGVAMLAVSLCLIGWTVREAVT
jgi:hypothetical protein